MLALGQLSIRRQCAGSTGIPVLGLHQTDLRPCFTAWSVKGQHRSADCWAVEAAAGYGGHIVLSFVPDPEKQMPAILTELYKHQQQIVGARVRVHPLRVVARVDGSLTIRVAAEKSQVGEILRNVAALGAEDPGVLLGVLPLKIPPR